MSHDPISLPGRTVIFDYGNREANVRGAEALGITGHLFTDVTGLRAFLTSLQ